MSKHLWLAAQKQASSLLLIILLLTGTITGFAQTKTRVEKVVLQGFWWDYYNKNFSSAWSNYLTELAPRLKAIGIDGVWYPNPVKSSDSNQVGYSPFDGYDLGDKYQKGGSGGLTVRTKMGTKDELLRMIAVLHANKLEAYEDVVLNHVDNAGSNTGAGGQDPEPTYSLANASGYKNFRYVSYATPAIDESQNDYWTRSGRWAKNYENFYPNPNNNCTGGDICSPYFGPDISYEANAIGRSTNIPASGTATIGTKKRAYYNPAQDSGWMRNGARNWLMWYKKQTGTDGFRWDACKHYPLYVQEDLTYNVKYLEPDFAKGGQSMFNVGEWIGTKSEIDAYVTNVRSGTEVTTGGFDFSLRGYSNSGGLYNMISYTGGYNMQSLPAEQVDIRYQDYDTQRVYRACPFVNSHDTYRPILDSVGNYSKPLGDASGWNTGSELGGNGQHIDARDPRLAGAYAVIFAMDGNPFVFFEDLFDIGTTGKRYTHLPASTTDLPVRPDIVNIIQTHQKLGFKNGDYGVPSSLTGSDAPYYQKGAAEDHLILERKGVAVIGITDQYSTVSDNSADQEAYVTVDASLKGKDLIDYSGAHGLTTTHVYDDGRVLIKTAPAGHTIAGARGHGYSVWAPLPAGVTFASVSSMYAYLATYSPAGSTTITQEWEMADDLGDSHPNSLMQGGALPAKSKAARTVGRIYADAKKVVTYKVYPEVDGRKQIVTLYSGTTKVKQSSGVSTAAAPLTGTYTPTKAGWLTFTVSNFDAKTTTSMKCYVNVQYSAPASVNTRTAQGVAAGNETSKTTLAVAAVASQKGFSIYPNPAKDHFVIEGGKLPAGAYQLRIVNGIGQVVATSSVLLNGNSPLLYTLPAALAPGVYSVQLQSKAGGEVRLGKLVID